MSVMADDTDPFAGLVDAAAPDADAQRVLASFLLDHGVPIEQLHEAYAARSMSLLVAGAVLWPDHSRITMAELAERVGLSEAVARRARGMLGFADPDDAAVCRSREVEMIGSFASGAALFGEERTLRMSRVLGTSTAAIAEAALSVFVGAVGAPLISAGVTDAEYGLQAGQAMVAFDGVCDAVDVMLRLHFERALARLGDDLTVDELQYAIGFVDIVESTAMAGSLEGGQVAEALRDFDRMAADASGRHDVRLVKLIGDAAMFAARDAVPLARTLADVVAAVDRHPVLRAAKGGLTFGEVAVHDGDYLGQVVNLAARAAGAAAPREVLLDAEAARRLPDRTEAAGSYELKGFEAPVALFRLVEAPPT